MRLRPSAPTPVSTGADRLVAQDPPGRQQQRPEAEQGGDRTDEGEDAGDREGDDTHDRGEIRAVGFRSPAQPGHDPVADPDRGHDPGEERERRQQEEQQAKPIGAPTTVTMSRIASSGSTTEPAIPTRSTGPGSRLMSDSAERTWRAPNAATRRAAATAASPSPRKSRMNAGMSMMPNAARSPSRVFTVPADGGVRRLGHGPVERPDVPGHGRPGLQVGAAVDDHQRLGRGAREGRGAADDHDRGDVAADPGVSADDDEGVEMIAGRDVHGSVDRHEHAARVRDGLGGEDGGGAEAQEEGDRGRHDEKSFHRCPLSGCPDSSGVRWMDRVVHVEATLDRRRDPIRPAGVFGVGLAPPPGPYGAYRSACRAARSGASSTGERSRAAGGDRRGLRAAARGPRPAHRGFRRGRGGRGRRRCRRSCRRSWSIARMCPSWTCACPPPSRTRDCAPRSRPAGACRVRRSSS